MARTFSNASKFIAPVVAVFVSMALLSPGVQAKKTRSRPSGRIASGVKYRLYRLEKPKNKVRVVTFSPSASATLDTVLANNQLPGRERVRSMANRSNAIVAINGDYSRPNGRPVFTFARDGSLDQGEVFDRATGRYMYGRNFAIDVGERRTFFGHPQTKSWVWDRKFGRTGSYQVKRVNDGSLKTASRRQLRAYTAAGGAAERPPRYGCYVRLQASERPRTTNVTRAPVNRQGRQIAAVGVEQRQFVTRSKCGRGPVLPRGGITLYAPKAGAYADALRAMSPGDEIFYGWSLGWPGVFDTVGGNPTLIEHGRVRYRSINDGSSFASGLHPRTAIAYNARNGKLFLVTVDGRQRRYSVGMSLRRLTKFLRRRLGATHALNLDGGGSTTMVVRGRVRGRPSDGSQRYVSSALVILPGRDPGERFGGYPSPPPAPTVTGTSSPAPTVSLVPPTSGLEVPVAPASETSQDGTYELMVADPASIGGLSAYLERKGYELPGFLERSAREFRATK